MRARQPKRPKYQGRMRTILAENVEGLMPLRFPEKNDRVKALAHAAGVSRSSVQRVVNAEHGASVDILEAIASALGVLPHELLVAKRVRR
jgi:transcriptional regulator with XRE-family HTH domain